MRPHYVRFAIALALAATPGCYQTHERDVDAGLIDAFVPDVPDMGPCARPLPCECPTLVHPGTCTDPYALCCPITGPLAPPSLPA